MRFRIASWLAGLAMLVIACAVVPAKAHGKPNFIIILVDDLGYADVGAYNRSTFYETPNIDRLAREGVQFTSGYAPAPVCSPSRLALLTGQTPARMKATDWFHPESYPSMAKRFRPGHAINRLPLEANTLAERLKAVGYRTAIIGKWHLGDEEAYWPEHQGFDINIAGYGRGHPASYFSPYDNPRLVDGPEGEYLTDRLTSETLRLLDQFQADDKPFLLYLPFYAVHTPIQAPPALVEKYRRKALELTQTAPVFGQEEQIWPEGGERPVRIRQTDPAYAAMVENMDTNVGRVLDKLRSSGLDRDTVVIFSSDNGGVSIGDGTPTSSLPLRGGKGWLYEGGLRVPFIVRMPEAGLSGRRSDTPVILTDIYPTVLDLASVDGRGSVRTDGRSLASFLRGRSARVANRPIFFHYPHYSPQGGFPGSAVRDGKWKLIERLEDGALQLFDLSADIGETRDMSKSKPRIAAKLRRRLHRWYRQVDAECLRPLETDAPRPWCYRQDD